jgi:hypothetical protein
MKKSNSNIVLELIVTLPFLQLKELILDSCGITSIEAIASLDAPILEMLSLLSNNIVSFKPLVKCKFLLENIYIGSREAQFDQLLHFGRVKLPSKLD